MMYIKEKIIFLQNRKPFLMAEFQVTNGVYCEKMPPDFIIKTRSIQISNILTLQLSHIEPYEGYNNNHFVTRGERFELIINDNIRWRYFDFESLTNAYHAILSEMEKK